MTRLLAFSHVAFGLRLTQQTNSKKVTYISNLEGDLDQLVLSLTDSDIKVTWHADHKLEEECEKEKVKAPYSNVACWPKLSLPEGQDQFVFGGNLFDHGMGDIRLANMFIKLYEECEKKGKCDPNDEDKGEDKLYYILGNRDILKMRYAVDIKQDLEAAVWNPAVQNLTGNEVELRKAQLSKTSGARESFEARRKEIQLLNLDDDEVEDHEVADSFKWMTGKGQAMGKAQPMMNLYRKYLKYADLIVKIGSTIYSHGAITKKNFLQGAEAKTKKGYYHNMGVYFDPVPLASVDAWIKSLRKLDDDMIDEWSKAIKARKAGQPLDALYPGRPLLNYMMSYFSEGKTVVESSIMNNFAMDQKKTEELAAAYKELLAKQGVKRFVGGFRSPGPVPVSESKHGIEFWNANMNFDGNGFDIKGRMSTRNGWARLEITDDEAKIVNQLPSNQ